MYPRAVLVTNWSTVENLPVREWFFWFFGSRADNKGVRGQAVEASGRVCDESRLDVKCDPDKKDGGEGCCARSTCDGPGGNWGIRYFLIFRERSQDTRGRFVRIFARDSLPELVQE